MSKEDIPKLTSGTADPSCIVGDVSEWCSWIAVSLPYTSCKDNDNLSSSSGLLQPPPVPTVAGGGAPLPIGNPWYLLLPQKIRFLVQMNVQT